MLITQKFIFRSDLQANPLVLYLFGDNLLRRGLGGQAKEMRGEPNAVGVATKRAPGMAPEDFFTDETFESNKESLRLDLSRAFAHVQQGGVVVVPADGLGTGLSELPTRAPKTHKALLDMIVELDRLARIEHSEAHYRRVYGR